MTEEQRERKRVYNREYHIKNRDRLRNYYDSHRDQRCRKSREYHYKNRERVLGKMREYKAAHREYFLQKQNDYIAHPSHRMVALTRAACRRAKNSNLPCDVALREQLKANPPTHCACCSCVLDYSTGRGMKDKYRSPSLDRVDNAKGYVLDNVEVICYRCNARKSDSTAADLRTILAYVEAHNGEGSIQG